MTFPCFQLQDREASDVRMALQSVKADGVFCLKGKEKNSKDWICSLSVEVVMGKKLDSSAPCLQKLRVKTIA